ncbi:hypothetical protein [Arthrobacter sp. MYb229]|uniref:hypothetical protein n=1 Tax=Arthrobacter sp. MYb229 TaxID=1848602 RepID=UPI0015E3A9F6|nr:hypothetical protein [Arthrobacter sp. MYb229]
MILPFGSFEARCHEPVVAVYEAPVTADRTVLLRPGKSRFTGIGHGQASLRGGANTTPVVLVEFMYELFLWKQMGNFGAKVPR